MVHPNYELEWPQVQRKLQQHVDHEVYDSWLRGLAFVSLRGDSQRQLTVSVATSFLKSWISKHYLEAVRVAADAVYGGVTSVAITIRAAGQRAPVLRPPPTIMPETPKKVMVTTGAGRVELITASHPHVQRAVAKPELEPVPEPEPESEPEMLPITPEEMEEMKRRRDRGIRLEDILTAVSRHFGQPVDEVISDSRLARVAIPRQVAMYLGYHLTKVPLGEIGKEFGGRGYGAVVMAKRRIQQRIKIDVALKESVTYLSRELQNSK